MIEQCLQTLELKEFRCFKSITFDFEGPLVLIQGLNGSGKTSMLEALHYLCYLRSFRTHSQKELVRFGAEGFFIKAVFNNQEIKIGCAGKKRHIKINQKAIQSYQELRQFYRVVTVTEDDLDLVKGSPEKRRHFLDHALLLHYPNLLPLFKEYKVVLDNRNALLHNQYINQDELEIWTKKLWETAQRVQEHRITFLKKLQQTSDTYLQEQWGDQYHILFDYIPKQNLHLLTWSEFFKKWKSEILPQEHRYRRSLFGAHLDDIAITFNQKPARFYSSRGQQKLIVLLIKIAQVKQLIEEQGGTTFLLDDFMTDFDKTAIDKLISACINLNTQLIFTTPVTESIDSTLLKNRGALCLKLTN